MNETPGFERVLYRNFRKAKVHYLNHPKAVLTRPFFHLLGVADLMLSPRKLTREEIAANEKWKDDYNKKYGDGPVFRVEAAERIAYASDDHKFPRGTLVDNSTNPRFNKRLYEFMPNRQLKTLDLGCSGGGLVRSLLRDGHTAIGLEGSDASQRARSGEWDTRDKHLFTANIAKPFAIYDAKTGERVLFDCITAWEVLEHIPESVLPGLIANIRDNLAPGGVFIGSVDMMPDGNPLLGAVYHTTLQSEAWWLAQFGAGNLAPVPKHPFEVRDYVRGHGMGLKDWDPADGDGFHVVVRRADEARSTSH